MYIVSLVDTVAGELRLITEQDVSMQLSIGTEPITKLQLVLSVITRFDVLNALYVVWTHAFFV
jgi:hypothetical protein